MHIDDFSLYLPVANISINFLILILIGLFVGFFSGMFGIGGGIIAIPILMFLGVPADIAASSVTNQTTATSLSSYLVYARRNRVDYKIASCLLIGSVLGILIGLLIFNHLVKIGQIDLFISAILLIVLSIIGTISTKDLIKILYYKYKRLHPPKPKDITIVRKLKFGLMTFPSAKQQISFLLPIITGIIGGLLVAIIGTGGSLVMIPIMLYVLGISPAYTPGTIHAQMIVTTILSTILHTYYGTSSLDIVLSSTIIIGAVFSARIGAHISAKFKSESLHIILTIIIFMLCVRVANNLFNEPDNIYNIEIIYDQR